jgi:hypothetical protein
MRIFVGYHFDPQDQWVKDLVYPIIQAFGDDVVTGENLYGQGSLAEAVRNRIQKCDALIGFATRRDKKDGYYATHRWVTDEISQGIAFKLKVVEVRENDVDPQEGIAAGCQYIAYNRAERDRCLVEVVKALGEWHRHNLVKLQLLPEEHVQQIISLLNHPHLRCVYQLYEEEEEEPSEERKLKLLGLGGGLFAYVRNVPRGAFVRVSIQCGARNWASEFESTSHHGIRLKEGPGV